MINTLIITLLQLVLIILVAPLVVGIIKKTKALFQIRKGPSIFQLYFDLNKYTHKESVISEHTSWIFRVTPYIYLSALIVAALLIPVISTKGLLNFTGDILLIIYLFALGRFFLTLAGLDAGSAFGGMASSREMTISAVAEPATLLPLFTMAITVGTTNLTKIVSDINDLGLSALTPAHMISFVALFIVSIAETGRIPVDNPDTHLELTMIHEGMLLEYSGKPLALLHLAAAIKQLLIFTLLANIFFPWGIDTKLSFLSLILAIIVYLVKVIFIGIIIAIIETSFAKMRLFKVPELLMGSFLVGLLGLITKVAFKG